MSKSLHEQLLQAGLVDKKKADQVARDKKNKQKKGSKKKKADKGKPDASKAAAMKAAQEKAERDRQLNEDRAKAQADKALVAQIKQLIETHRREKTPGESLYRFKDGKKIHTLMLSEPLTKELFSGRVQVVRWGGSFELLPAEAADKVAARDESLVIPLVESNEPSPEDDPYADYQIPDDLMW